MKSGLTQCAECGTLTPNDFCSRECEDLYIYGSAQAGRSLLSEISTSHHGKRPTSRGAARAAVPREPVNLENLPF